MKHSLIKKLKQRGGIVIKPNPIIENWLLLKFAKAANRYHQKVKLIDNDIFIGSLNSNNQYTGMRYGTFKYIDLSLYLKNSPVASKVAQFFSNIIKDNKKYIKTQNGQVNLDNIIEVDKKMQLTQKNHFKNENKDNTSFDEDFLEETPPKKSEISNSIIETLENAKDCITIVQSYYLNIQKIEEILLRALKRGVRVEIITAKKRDQLSYKYFLNEILFEKLLQNGATVYEFLDKSFHMKAYYIDNKMLNLGSFNNDITSFYCNNEANYLIRKNSQNDKIFMEFNKMIENIKKNCQKVNYIPRNQFPFWRRFTFTFFSIGFMMIGKFLTTRKNKL